MGHFRYEDDGRCPPRFPPLAIAGMVLAGIVFGVIFAFLFGWAVMLLWNWLMPAIFGLPTITYWQGWGLLLLSHILIKGGWHGGRGGHRHGKRHGRGGKWEWDREGGWHRVKEEIAREVDDAVKEAKGERPEGN